MAIDYNRRSKTPAPQPGSGGSGGTPAGPPPASDGPSWYTPPGSEPEPPPAAPPAAPAPPAPSRAVPSAPAAGGGGPRPGVSLSKVTLTKASPQVSLSKTGGGSGVIRVNLNWSAGTPTASTGGGFFKRLTQAAPKGVDLDLGCLWELADGSKGVVQALGNAFGSLQTPPYIALDGDDRSGSNVGGENMSINLAPGRFRRVLIFAMIYEGAPNWAAVDGVVTLSPVAGPPIEVRLDATSDQARICAVAQLVDERGDLVVKREVNYVNGGQSVLDKMYGWGMNWSPGRK